MARRGQLVFRQSVALTPLNSAMHESGSWYKLAQTASVTSFCGPGAAGNRHKLFYSAQGGNWDKVSLPDELRKIPNLILLHGPPEALQAQFWDRGQPVRRCGSGNIAISAFARYYLSESQNFSLHLQTLAGSLALGHDRFGPYYTSPPEPQYPLVRRGFWQHLLDQDFAAAGLAGGPSDYALLELERPPAKLHLRTARLKRLSRRALIVFCPLGPGNVQMRYFAPQHGRDEDAATGSAAVQVAEYLWRRYRWRSCRVLQQSAGGGLIQTEMLGRQVRVRGEAWVEELQTPDSGGNHV